MNSRDAIRSQYHAALLMLRQAIDKCPDAFWDDTGDRNRFWHVAYHVLFFTHLYLQNRHEEFRPWSGHRENYQYLGSLPGQPDKKPEIGEPYRKEDVLAYLDVCRRQVDEKTAILDVDAAASGFPWLPFGKLELQIYNIRHIQQHAGELMERLGARAGIDVDWVALQHD
jgi:hypothetical protein